MCGVAWRGEEGRGCSHPGVPACIFWSSRRYRGHASCGLNAHAYSRPCTLNSRLQVPQVPQACTDLRVRRSHSAQSMQLTTGRKGSSTSLALRTRGLNTGVFYHLFSFLPSFLTSPSRCLARPHVHAPPSASVSLGCRGAAGEDPASLAPWGYAEHKRGTCVSATQSRRRMCQSTAPRCTAMGFGELSLFRLASCRFRLIYF